MVSPKKVKVMVSATLEDGTVSHFELPVNAALFTSFGDGLVMGFVQTYSTTVSPNEVRTSLEVIHTPIHTVGYSGAANTHLSPEELAQVCKCGHTRGEHMSNTPHPCAQERHCQAFEPSGVDPTHNPSFVGKCGVLHPQYFLSLAFRGIACTRECDHEGDHYYRSPNETRWSNSPQPANNRKDEAEW